MSSRYSIRTIQEREGYIIPNYTMNRKKLFIRVILALIIILVIATTIAYFVLQGEKPMLALFVACCGGVLLINLLVSLFLVNKNFKKED